MEKTPGCRYKMSKFVPFGSLCNYFGVSVGIWCAHVPPGTLAAAKIHIFPTNFNDFINPFGVTLGCLWGHFAHFGITSGPLFGHFGITLESPLVCEGPFSKNTHSVQYKVIVFYTALVLTCGHFGVTLRYFGYMKMTLDHSWVTLSPLGMHFEHMMRICAFKSPHCAKYTHFSHEFEWFYK